MPMGRTPYVGGVTLRTMGAVVRAGVRCGMRAWPLGRRSPKPLSRLCLVVGSPDATGLRGVSPRGAHGATLPRRRTRVRVAMPAGAPVRLHQM
ncbi:protein of unknown function [Ralstonia solanacearum PSI07]|nr:protein of unknown function [Ralstonia solanacearum PSI07]